MRKRNRCESDVGVYVNEFLGGCKISEVSSSTTTFRALFFERSGRTNLVKEGFTPKGLLALFISKINVINVCLFACCILDRIYLEVLEILKLLIRPKDYEIIILFIKCCFEKKKENKTDLILLSQTDEIDDFRGKK